MQILILINKRIIFIHNRLCSENYLYNGLIKRDGCPIHGAFSAPPPILRNKDIPELSSEDLPQVSEIGPVIPRFVPETSYITL